MGDIAILILSFAIRTILLTLMLWVMVKLQKLNYFFLGLLVSAALACGLDLIPYAGHYLAVAVLYFCIWKITGASLFPDAVFTVVVSYALVFAVNMLLLTALMGDLRPQAANHDPSKPPPVVQATKPPPPPAAAIQATNPPVAAPAKTTAPTNSVSVDDLLKNVVVEGATQNGDKSMLVIKVNRKTYTLVMGEQTAVPLTNGPCQMRLKNLDRAWATVTVNGEAAYLRVP